jgi:hypothetical protein
MKKFFVMVVFLAAAVFSVSLPHCEAKDVWVDRWQNINADIYVMDDTIEYEENLEGKFFKVSTKTVQNGKLKNIIKWKYIKHGQEMWRYETNQMGGSHMTVVSPGDKLFAFCMKRIGWNYRTEDFWCY